MQSFMPSEAAEVRSKWGWYVGYGVLLIVVGLVALWNAVDATLVTTVFVGLMLIIGGGVELASAFSAPRSLGGRLLHILLGLLYVVAGVYLIVNPVIGAITLAIIVAITLIADGILRIWFGLTEDIAQKWLLVAVGVIDVLLGLWLWTNIPVSALAIGFYVGVALLMAGITWVAVGWSARSLPDTPGGTPA